MKNLVIVILSLLAISCSDIDDSYNYSRDDFAVMYEFVDNIHQSDLFNVGSPNGKTFEELMLISGSVVMSDVFADTMGEGECEQVYRAMFRFYSAEYPESSVTKHLEFLLTNGLY